MRTWLLTSTTYGTWLPGDPRGSVTSVRENRTDDGNSDARIEHDLPGEPYIESIPALVESARRLMRGPPIHFQLNHAECVLKQFQETAAFRDWRLLAVSIMFNHFHLVVEVEGDPSPGKILGDLKAYATRALNREFGRPQSETWWTTNGSTRLAKDSLAIQSMTNYVLNRQPNPLIVWSPDVEPVA